MIDRARWALWTSLFFLTVSTFDSAEALRLQAGTLPSRPVLAAHAITEPIEVDGRLDEEAWQSAGIGTGFIQREPFDGRPASERTEVRVLYTPSVLYIGILAFDAEPEAIIARELQRDADLGRDDSIVILLDTFNDHRNAYQFSTNPNGARTDAQVTDEGRDVNRQWDGLWSVGARRDDQGWSAEFAIPFSTLRYAPNTDTWGFQLLRRIRRKSEEAFWSPIPIEANLFRISMAGELTGIGTLAPTQNIDILPFTVGTLADGIDEPEDDATVGLDLKWGVARSIVLDLTYNTDFAEVEVDEEQVNLTRFSLFFPEKREFFLENSGLFDFGAVRSQQGFRSAPVLQVFFSRRIGIEDELIVPMQWGARLTGRVSGWNIGVLQAQTSETESVSQTDFSVVRLKRNIGLRSSVGMIYTGRDEHDGRVNRVYGLDTTIKPTEKIDVNAFFTQSQDSELGDDQAAGLSASYRAREWEASLESFEIGENYDPGIGFLLREGVRRFKPKVDYRPRLEKHGIRTLNFGLELDRFSTLEGELESSRWDLDYFGLRSLKDDGFQLSMQLESEQLFEPFDIFDDIIIPTGLYDFDPRWSFRAFSNSSRKISARGFYSTGGFYDGKRDSLSATLTLRPSRFFRSETNWSHDDVDLPQGAFTTDVYRQRLAFSFSTEIFLDGLLQYNTGDKDAGVFLRLRWIYRPGSDVFLVYTENLVEDFVGDLTTQERRLILKMTYLVRM